MKVLVTGSSGLIGSEAVVHYHRLGHRVIGVDNNMRATFFGPAGDTSWNLARLRAECPGFQHEPIDIRDRAAVDALFRNERPDVVVHCAAQPSHDKARDIPVLDFEVNAMGTLNLLEATRQHSPAAVFLHMSTNKVYGDAPNELPLIEHATRYDYADPALHEGIDETMRIDRSTHSLMGASKTAADIMAQEYGRYYGLAVGVFRGGCLTGPAHSGVQLHGFLNYLVRTVVRGGRYTVFGYKGKQVRDNIHSADVISAFDAFLAKPRPGEVYNIGGGRANSVSVIEAIARIEQLAGRRLDYTIDPRHRTGDHICYISDMAKFRAHYPEWRLTRSLDSILAEMVAAEQARLESE
jgi:CDP-paratose 2-epimerase